MFKDKYQHGQNVQLLNIQGKLIPSVTFLLSREGNNQEVDGQWLHQESLRPLRQGLRLHHRRQLKTSTSPGHQTPRALLDPAIPKLPSESPRQKAVSL